MKIMAKPQNPIFLNMHNFHSLKLFNLKKFFNTNKSSHKLLKRFPERPSTRDPQKMAGPRFLRAAVGGAACQWALESAYNSLFFLLIFDLKTLKDFYLSFEI